MRHAMAIYDRATRAVDASHQLDMYFLYIKKAEKYYGVARTREIHERAIKVLPDDAAKKMCLQVRTKHRASGVVLWEFEGLEKTSPRRDVAWREAASRGVARSGFASRRDAARLRVNSLATCRWRVVARGWRVAGSVACRLLQYMALERKLGEIDRARAILAHGSQFADPRRDPAFWQSWHEFEVAHGNEETFREMLRVKRSVQTAFSQVNYMASEMLAGEAPIMSDAEALAKQGGADDARGHKRKAAEGGAAETEMAALERQAARIAAAVTTGDGAAENGQAGGGGENPEEISLDDDDDDAEIEVETKAVPAAVFGEVAQSQATGDGDGAATGALARFKGAT